MSTRTANKAYLPQTQHTYYPITPPTTAMRRSQSPLTRTITTPTPSQSYHNHHSQRQFQALRKINDELREREQIYIEKLMKLQEGLQKQHSQFVKLQQLYTELFESYKQKQVQIAEQLKYRQTERNKDTQRNKVAERKQIVRVGGQRLEWEQQWNARQKHWHSKQASWQTQQHQLRNANHALAQQLAAAQDNHQRALQEALSLRQKERASSSRVTVTEKSLEESREYLGLLDQEREARLKFQYENDFLRNRNTDLESQRAQLQQLLAHKQQELVHLRQQKIRIHRKSSQKLVRMSPRSSDTKRRTGGECSTEQRATERPGDSRKHQYFSFAGRQEGEQGAKREQEEDELPTFPPQLEIDNLINQHRK